jgi:hypothetical protein
MSPSLAFRVLGPLASAWLLLASPAPAAAQEVPVAETSNEPSADPAVATPDADQATSKAKEAARGRWLLVPYPITDPALGNGVLGGLVRLRAGPPAAAGPSRPQAYGVGALWTDGGSTGLIAADHRAWKGGTWRTTALAGDVELHFDYSGIRPGQDDDVGFIIQAQGGSLAAERVLGGGPNTLKLNVFSAQADVSFEEVPPPEAVEDIGSSTLAGVTLGWTRDTRDDVFLPARGTALAAEMTVMPEVLGASFDSQSVALKATHYRPLGHGVLGLRAKSNFSFGDPPFYLRPFVSFRGVAALRYPGETVASLEAEYRHPIRGQWHALVFAGSGRARSDFRGIDVNKTVSAGGVGVRYRAAKLFGLTLGVDAAQGPDGLVTYIQIGNTWTN